MRDAPKSLDLLEWYDRHARKMPWRVDPEQGRSGIKPDPYRVWLSEVMLQQTTVAAVRDYFTRFVNLWPTVNDLALADDADVMAQWAGLGYYARARNLLKCARVIHRDMNGAFPDTYEGLIKLPGIGPYTAAAIASIAFDQQATVVDGNVERVISRIFDIHAPLPQSKAQLTDLAATLTPEKRPGDYAQAIMDLGATICTPKNPACGLCPWRKNCCGYAAGTHLDLPRKAPKTPKPKRYGIAYVARRVDGALLLERRPDSGLLGGMLGWPTTDWGDDPMPAPPIRAEWKTSDRTVKHTFTHFHLFLTVKTAYVPMDRAPQRGTFMELDTFDPSDLPTLMRKVFDAVSAKSNS